MKYKKRIKLLKLIGKIMMTSNKSRKNIYRLIINPEAKNLGSTQLAKKAINIEERDSNMSTATNLYTQLSSELLLEAIIVLHNKEEHSNLIKMIMSFIVAGPKNSILSNHAITATKKGFTVDASAGLFSKKSHHLTPAMLEYIISNGETKRDSKGKIPSDVIDSLIESTLEFNSSKNGHDKFLKICDEASIQSEEDMETELENAYKIKNKIPKYIVDLAYSISIEHITISRLDRLIISYKNKDHGMTRANIDLSDYRFFLDSLLRGESIAKVIDSFNSFTAKKG